MRRFWSRSLLAVGAAVVSAMALAAPAQAYSPGSATAYKPTLINGNTWDYHCSFSGWRSGAKVVWQCNLHEVTVNEYGGFIEDHKIRSNSGSWTPGSTSYTTTTFHKVMEIDEGTYCVEAYAYSVDGGVTSKYACN